jgi:hypothetical protein
LVSDKTFRKSNTNKTSNGLVVWYKIQFVDASMGTAQKRARMLGLQTDQGGFQESPKLVSWVLPKNIKEQ